MSNTNEGQKEPNKSKPAKTVENAENNQNLSLADSGYMGKSLEQLSLAFSASARRWELVVYPSLIAFIILSIYGFYLIFNLTQDIKRTAINLENITDSMIAVSSHMTYLTNEVRRESETMRDMVTVMSDMNNSMYTMTGSVENLRYHMAMMNNSVSRPMSFMNTFMPW